MKTISPIIAITLSANLLMLSASSSAQTPVFPPEQIFQQPSSGLPPVLPAYPNANPGSFGQMNPQPTQNYQLPANQIPRQQQAQAQVREFSGYLGIVLDLVPTAVSAQLPKDVKQGILIKSFSSDSPAASSELKPFDVMFAYDDIRLNHPDQFIKIVRQDQPGREVKIKVVRKGEILEIPVVIGAQKTPDPKEFNGLAIKQISKDKYRAIVRFVGPSGNKQVRTYEGNREEIFEQAQYAQDLPQAERQQLLYATRPRNKKSNSGFGSFFPFGGNNNSGNNWMNPRKYFNW